MKEENRGLFVFHDQLIPREILHSIMAFIPAFPFYFMLRSVCRQWLSEFQDHIYAKVEHLNLVDDGKPKYYFRSRDNHDEGGQATLVQFKPIGFIGTNNELTFPSYDKTHLFEFLAQSFPNVKHLRLGLGSLYFIHFTQCVKAMLPKLIQLETLVIVGTVDYYSQSEMNALELIACSLPRSTKNLKFIGVDMHNWYTFRWLKMFSNKGRQSMPQINSPTPPEVDIQCLSLSYLLLHQNHLNDNAWDSLKEFYSQCEISAVHSVSHNRSPSTLPVLVSPVDYLNYMSRREGIVLSRMINMRRDSPEIMEAVIDIAVREYPYFQPLLSQSTEEYPTLARLIAPQTKLDTQFVVTTCTEVLLRTLELLTDPSRMKYPELVFNINSSTTTLVEESCSRENRATRSTLLNHLIAQCEKEQELRDKLFIVIQTIVETYSPFMDVNDVQSYVQLTLHYVQQFLQDNEIDDALIYQ